ncbi:MAG: hypothetical protein JW889_02655 [Verrucomicrobia bacterium]|nr:hypothetical protein [Verrucomicrobiota bacterium]
MDRVLPYLLALLVIGLSLLAFGEEPSSAEEGVLLRYRLDPGDVQVFEADVKLDMVVNALQGSRSEDAATKMAIHMPFSILGTATNDDGTMQAEVAIHGLSLDMTMSMAGERMEMKADECGIEIKRNGTPFISGEWGSAQLSQFPDLSRLLSQKIEARFNDRGEMIDMGGLDALANQIQGLDLSQAFDNQIVYPEQAVRQGDSWTHEVTEAIANPAQPGGKMTIEAIATYTVLDRLTYRNRDCLKLRIQADFTNPPATGAVRFEQKVNGTAYVDVASGVPLGCRLEITQQIQGTVGGVGVTLNGSGTVDLRYAGGRQRYDELIRDSAATGAAVHLQSLSIPMVTEKTITINKERYAKGETLNVGDEQYRIVAFRPTTLKLHRLSNSAVYQLGLGAGGRVAYVKLLGFAE